MLQISIPFFSLFFYIKKFEAKNYPTPKLGIFLSNCIVTLVLFVLLINISCIIGIGKYFVNHLLINVKSFCQLEKCISCRSFLAKLAFLSFFLSYYFLLWASVKTELLKICCHPLFEFNWYRSHCHHYPRQPAILLRSSPCSASWSWNPSVKNCAVSCWSNSFLIFASNLAWESEID